MNCIYMLCDMEEVVYVGKSVAISGRLHTHKKSDKLYDSFVLVEVVNQADMHILELVLINKYKPRYNIGSKSEDEMTIKIAFPNASKLNITEYATADGGITEDNIVVGSSVVADLKVYLCSIEGDNSLSSLESGFKYTVLQKTAIALLTASKKGITGVAARKQYGVKSSSYKIMNKYFDKSNPKHLELLNGIITNTGQVVKSIPECALILKEIYNGIYKDS